MDATTMTTTTRQIDEAADLRGVLLAALGMGGWEAEHLSGLALARRLAALHLSALDRLAAQSTRMQRLACDVQELLSGEEWDRLRGHVASVEADNARLRAAVGVAAGLAEEAWHRVRDSAPMAAMGYCEHVATLATVVVGRAPDAALTDGEKALLVEVRRAVAEADQEEVRNGRDAGSEKGGA